MLKAEDDPVQESIEHRYFAYGLNIISDVDLPGICEGINDDAAEVNIRVARPFEGSGPSDVHDGGDYLALQHAQSVRFRVANGTSILFLPPEESRPEMGGYMIRSLAVGLAMALLLRQRGHFVLHACVVAREGEAIGFVGDSGFGKSTLAEFFFQQGYSVLCDDVAALTISDNGVWALPGNPVIKLRPGSEGIIADRASMDRQLDGRLHVAKPFDHDGRPVPLKKLYLLQNAYPGLSIEDVPPSQRMIELIRNVHGAHILTRPDYQAQLLHQANQLAQQVPISLLRRPKGLDKLPLILEAVEQDLAQLTSTAS